MLIDGFATMVAGFAMAFISGAQSAPCSSSPVTMDVATAADVQGLTANMTCTGEGVFDVTWYGSLGIEQTLVVSGQKSVHITGSSNLSTSTANPDPNEPDAIINGGKTTRIFLVSNGSTLTLNNLVVNGGYSEESGGGVAVLSSASLNVSGCAFTNNRAATSGGEAVICVAENLRPKRRKIHVYPSVTAPRPLSLLDVT